MKVVTSGSTYLDIDAYGGMIAYAELLNLQGTKALSATTAPLNESISKTARTWPVNLVTNYQASQQDTYVLIDVSDPDYFDVFVAQDRVVEVIDHHAGFEDYWLQRIGESSEIDFIGAACTLVYERWKAALLLDKMSESSARLLQCGILDNTLNFGARVTTTRDKQAYDVLKSIANLPEDWAARYFLECQKAISADTKTALNKDTKVLNLKTGQLPLCAGQLVVWDVKTVIAECSQIITETLGAKSPEWFLNLISVSEGKSYFYSGSAQAKQWLSCTLGVAFNGELAVADRLWLRKEIIKRDIELAL